MVMRMYNHRKIYQSPKNNYTIVSRWYYAIVCARGSINQPLKLRIEPRICLVSRSIEEVCKMVRSLMMC